MTNAPENFDSFVLPAGVDKLEYIPDTKVQNAGVFRIEREDHTLANLIRMQLLRDPDVIFVGYTHPHPIQHHILLRIQTCAKSNTGLPYSPPEAFMNAVTDVRTEIIQIGEQVNSQLGLPLEDKAPYNYN